MKTLTSSQREALLVAADRDPLPVYAANTNGKGFVTSGAARVLVDRGLLADLSAGALTTLRITVQGRAAAGALRKENHHDR